MYVLCQRGKRGITLEILTKFGPLPDWPVTPSRLRCLILMVTTGSLSSRTCFIPKFESELVLTLLHRNCLFRVSAHFNTADPLSPRTVLLFLGPRCLTYRRISRSDNFSNSTSPRVHLFSAHVVRVGIKLLTQDQPDVPDNLNHSSVAAGVCN